MTQYPHTIEIKNGNTILQLSGRWEIFSGSRIVVFNNQEVLVKGIFYMPLPVPDLKETWAANVFNTNYTGGQTQGITANTYSFKPSVQIKTDVTTIAGNVVFEGGNTSATVNDWTGWNLKIERIQSGTMRTDVDYSWNQSEGTLQLLEAGDTFQPNEWFDITFEPKISNGIITGETTITDLGLFLYGGTIKQFSRGQLNARIWL